MPQYSHSKVYKITNSINDKFYIGSTAAQNKTLKDRMDNHKKCANDISGRRNSVLYNNMRELGIHHFKIELIEEMCFNTKRELVEREQYYIDLMKPQLNQFRSIANPHYEKDRYLRDKNKRLLLSKMYYENNKDHIAETGKQYRIDNNEHIKEQKQQYRINNKEAIQERKKQIIVCECGINTNSSHKSRHIKSKQHLELMSKLNL